MSPLCLYERSLTSAVDAGRCHPNHDRRCFACPFIAGRSFGLSPVIVAATFGIANAILLEAGLSFLGLGVQPPTASWGNMLTDAQFLTVLESMPWLWLPPGVTIAVAVLSINFIGDGLRDALDPYLLR